MDTKHADVDAPHVVFSGGGTGGHLFPGLAVAEELARRLPGVRVTFAGTGKPLEYRHVAAAGFDYWAIAARPLPRRVGEVFAFLVENAAGHAQARRLLGDGRADVVVGLGGYSSVPVARQAVRRRIPLILLEQNAVAGRATRWLARHASLVCAGMAQTRNGLSRKGPIRVTGTPVRFDSGTKAWGTKVWGTTAWGTTTRDTAALCHQLPTKPTGEGPMSPQHGLLILGGSSGARTLNENVPRALYRLRNRLTGWHIIHQTGSADLEATRSLYGKLGLEAEVHPFIDQVATLMPKCRLAICRAGGSTLAELAVARLPAVLVPYPFAVADHQRKNADAFVHGGGAVLLDQREVTGRFDHQLADVVAPLLNDSAGRDRMSAAMQRLAHPNAAADVAHAILETIGQETRATRKVAA